MASEQASKAEVRTSPAFTTFPRALMNYQTSFTYYETNDHNQSLSDIHAALRFASATEEEQRTVC